MHNAEKKRMLARVGTVLAICGLAGACATPADRTASATRIAATAGLSRATFTTNTFRIVGFTRFSDPAAPASVYIEGDGFAWATRNRPSLDPTPTKAMGLRLAALDPSPNVIYLARPCQFVGHDPACRTAYWTGLRYAEEVVTSMNDALTQAMAPLPGQGIRLVGYSGGGAIATLLAERRVDVLSLRTVAGNLDIAAVNRHHRVSPMPESLNPIDAAARLAALPQIHFVGGKDSVVPPFIAQGFVAALGNDRCARIERIPMATHEDGWEDAWRTEVKMPPTCRLGNR